MRFLKNIFKRLNIDHPGISLPKKNYIAELLRIFLKIRDSMHAKEMWLKPLKEQWLVMHGTMPFTYRFIWEYKSAFLVMVKGEEKKKKQTKSKCSKRLLKSIKRLQNL